MVHVRPLRVAARHQHRTRRAANSVRIRLRETHTGFSQLIHGWRVQILRAITIGIERPLIVREEDHNVGFPALGVGRGGIE